MGLMKQSKITLKIKDFTDAYIFQADVGVLWVVWKSVPRPIIWCSAPVVPILMLATVSNDTRLQKKMRKKKKIFQAQILQILVCRSRCFLLYIIMLHEQEPVLEALINGNVWLTGTVHENLILEPLQSSEHLQSRLMWFLATNSNTPECCTAMMNKQES